MSMDIAVNIPQGLKPIDEPGAVPSSAFVERDGETFLLGGVVTATEKSFFPKAPFAAGSLDIADALIGPSGALYSFTTIHVSQGRPTPYTIGYVDFECGARVLAPIQGDPADLHCDLRVRLGNDGTSWFVTREVSR